MTALLEKPADLPAVASPAPILNAAHRCDAPVIKAAGAGCGAQARSFVLLPSGLSLTFCSHHTEEKQERLEAAGATIYKQYEGLTARLDVSPA